MKARDHMSIRYRSSHAFNTRGGLDVTKGMHLLVLRSGLSMLGYCTSARAGRAVGAMSSKSTTALTTMARRVFQ